jgi:hypothetical protein
MVTVAHCRKLFGRIIDILMTPHADHRLGCGYCKVYREINERTSSRGSHKKPYPLDSSSRGVSAHRTSPDQTSIAFKGPGHLLQTHGSGDQGTFKLNGLIKKVRSAVDSVVCSPDEESADDYSDSRGVRPSPDILLHFRGYPVRQTQGAHVDPPTSPPRTDYPFAVEAIKQARRYGTAYATTHFPFNKFPRSSEGRDRA